MKNESPRPTVERQLSAHRRHLSARPHRPTFRAGMSDGKLIAILGGGLAGVVGICVLVVCLIAFGNDDDRPRRGTGPQAAYETSTPPQGPASPNRDDEGEQTASDTRQPTPATHRGRPEDADSANEAIRRALAELDEHYNGTVRVLGGIGANDGSEAQAMFSFTKNGRTQSGLIKAVRENNRYRVETETAPPDRLADALAGGEQPTRQTDAGPDPVPTLTAQRLPDGTGTIKLPRGWRITEAYQGAVGAVGPNGDIVELGGFAEMCTQNVGGRMPNFCPWGEASQIFPTGTQTFWNILAMGGGPQREFVKLVETKAMQGQPNAQTLLAVYDWKMNGRTYRSLGLFIAAPTSNVTWLYYLSSVSAPKEQFARHLPTLLAIWESRQVDPGVTYRRLKAAADSMNACTRIVQEVTVTRAQAADRATDSWIEYIRGQTFLRDAQTGEVHELPYDDLDQMVRRQNEQEGFNRFEVVPRAELQP